MTILTLSSSSSSNSRSARHPREIMMGEGGEDPFSRRRKFVLRVWSFRLTGKLRILFGLSNSALEKVKHYEHLNKHIQIYDNSNIKKRIIVNLKENVKIWLILFIMEFDVITLVLILNWPITWDYQWFSKTVKPVNWSICSRCSFRVADIPLWPFLVDWSL